MSNWNSKENPDMGVPLQAQSNTNIPGSTNSSINIPKVTMASSSTPSKPLQSFSHQPPVLPPPSAIGSSQSHLYQFPALSNLNNLPRYNFPVSNTNVGQTQLPSFNIISKGVSESTPGKQENIQLPHTDQILPSPPTNLVNTKLTSNISSDTKELNGAESVPVSVSVSVKDSVSAPTATSTSDTKPVSTIGAESVPSSATVTSSVTNTPHEQQPSSYAEQKGNPNYKPLNVKDALYYLDLVKLQFRNQTDVYNNFLDIMKDFKSQNIDTPGVIERVSSLFKGHPKLIDGFNTFLPQGFSISCSKSDPNTIIVTTPMGTSTRKDSSTLSASQKEQVQSELARDKTSNTLPANKLEVQNASSNFYYPNNGRKPNGDSANESIQHQIAQSNDVQRAPEKNDEESKQSTPAEFDQAINYVNKIKQREAPDLLEDFKLFMPDNTVIKDVQPQEYAYNQYYSQPVQLPPVGNFQSASSPNGQNLASQMIMSQTQYPISQVGPEAQQHVDQYQTYGQQQQQAQQQQQHQQQQYQTPLYQQNDNLPVKDKKKKGSISGMSQVQTLQKQGQLQPHDEFPVSNLRGASYGKESPALISGVLDPVYPKLLDTDLSNDIAFFDKVKKAISNKQTYNEFLKLLKLYSSDVIDKSTLHDKARTLIGGFTEIFQWFCDFIGWEESPLRIENIAIKKQQLDLMMCKAAGPSYRQLPKSQTKMPCSGRDDLCWSIFNDEWVGHPVWASEESGFIAHRKNQYEEMLFRIEDERHEYDYFMEANLRTIQTLETIANRMANMSPEEKSKFKLPVGLGHTSSTIYVKVIRKIYDKDRGWEVIDALHENPAISVPIVLKRLKQKDEEWKRVHREWNKVWREAEQKLLIKSLDHLGLSFKNIDKKLLTNKQLVSEISTIKQEQVNKKLHPLMTRPKSELITKYEDFGILMDIVKLVNTNLRHNQVYSQNDKERMETFMKSFLVKFFFMDPQFINSELKKRGISTSNNENADLTENIKEEETSKLNIPTLSQAKKRPREYDLLRDVLRKNKRKRNDAQQQHGEQDQTEEDSISEEVQKAQATWISNDLITNCKEGERSIYNMFSNTQIYVFYRHLDTLYKRLLEIKKMAPDVNKEVTSRSATKFAVDLGLIDRHLEDSGIAIKGIDSYSEAVELCVKLIDNKLEQSSFEEALRNGFRNKAFKLFTIDRVIQSLMKHCHTIVSDSKCSEILLLMEKDRNQPTTSIKDQILYRIQVRSFMNPDENMFKIMYDKASSTTTITFLALEDLTIKDESETKENRWKYYLTSYSMSHPTEGLEADKINLPFLKSQLDNEQENENEIEGVVDSKLSVKIDMDSYRMRFEPDTYDLFIRNSLYSNIATSFRTRETRIKKLNEVVNGDYGIAGDLNADELKLSNEKIEILKEKGPEQYLKFNIKEAEKKEAEQKVAEGKPEAKVEDSANSGKETKSEKKESMAVDQKTDVASKANEEGEVSDVNKDTKNEIKTENGITMAVECKESIAAETTVVEGDSTIQQDETVERVEL